MTSGMGSAWGPLRQPVFRAVWIAALASNVGTLMQGVAAAWLMTALTPSPLLVALLTTAGSLPLFLVGLPAGALADVIDRRWLVVVTQAWMLAMAAVLGALTIIGWMSPGGLLALTFLLGLGGALSAPAWQAIVPELVGKRDLGKAIALNSAGFNMARAIGPAAGGLVVAAAGAGPVFLLNAISFLGVMIVIYRWKPAAEETNLPSESVRGAVTAGVRYTRHSKPLRAILVRTTAFIIAASALWALIPVVAARDLHLSAFGYGVLLASLGIGAVVGATVMPRLRARFSADRLVVFGSVGWAAGILALAFIHNLIVLNAVLLLMGAIWLITNSCLNIAVQTMAPNWVSARALGVYLLVYQGGFAGGGALWGLLASHFNNQIALASAASMLLLGLLTALRWPLLTGEDLDLSPSHHWKELKLALDPDPEAGPVLVTIDYRVADAQSKEFVQAMAGVQVMRRRDGAVRWELFRDPSDPERYVEAYELASWAEHLRHHERSTVLDRDVEERARAFRRPGTATQVSNLIAVKPVD